MTTVCESRRCCKCCKGRSRGERRWGWKDKSCPLSHGKKNRIVTEKDFRIEDFRTEGSHMKLSRLALFSWFLVGYNVLVILWGAFVRASGSGAGCGSHWPLCNGEVVPLNPSIERTIEFTHRVMSGIDLPLILLLAFFVFRAFPWG